MDSGFVTILAMSEANRRLIWAIIIIILLVPVLLGYIGMWIRKVMRWQGKRMDILCHDVVVTKVITDKESLRRYGNKKNMAYFFKQSWIPFVIMLAAVLTLIINDAIIKDFGYNPFNNETGFGSLLWHWDWSDPSIRTTFWGMEVIASWPPLTASPHFEVEAIGGYLFTIIGSVGLVYWMVTVQCYISRWWRLRKLCDSIFSKSLEGYHQDPGSGIGGMPSGMGGGTTQNAQGTNTTTTNNSETTNVSILDANERPPIGGQK